MRYSQHLENPDVILIGTGVMSANLGVLLKRLDPSLSIQAYEVTEELAPEASHGWNNAGTGHAGIAGRTTKAFRRSYDFIILQIGYLTFY